MNFDKKKIVGLIAFIAGIILITSSARIPLPNTFVYVIGALLVAYGTLNLMSIIHTIASDKKKIIGLIAFIIGILLITISAQIPILNIIVNVIGALLIAYGVLSLGDIV